MTDAKVYTITDLYLLDLNEGDKVVQLSDYEALQAELKKYMPYTPNGCHAMFEEATKAYNEQETLRTKLKVAQEQIDTLNRHIACPYDHSFPGLCTKCGYVKP